MKTTIGGNRLGSGKKMTTDLKTYNRSTHDLSYVWRNTQAAGTLVPFMSEVALPGDTFDIDLDVDIMTHPTVGPLFGSFKVQLDVFTVPIRLYNAGLHNNMINVGLDMSAIKLPIIEMSVSATDWTKPVDNQQINPSCIFNYLGIRGLGNNLNPLTEAYRWFNAVPWLGYWDIYKNYYANKQEEIGAVIHYTPAISPQTIDDIIINDTPTGVVGTLQESPAADYFQPDFTSVFLEVNFTGATPLPEQILIRLDTTTGGIVEYSLTQLFQIVNNAGTKFICSNANYDGAYINWRYADGNELLSDEPVVYTFPLENIDLVRKQLLVQSLSAHFELNNTSTEPYNLPLLSTGTIPNKIYAKMSTQEGLALKTYQSDIFNNWMQTEWIDGVNGISAVTAIDTTGGSFTIDQLNISKKVYDMLNRIAISGGSYSDWIETVYTNDRMRLEEIPMYRGGLIKELVFEQVVSNSGSQTDEGKQPLGTLGGRGRLSSKHKGGKIVIKIDEPSYIMGIASLTPRIDYSQGNRWDVTLETLDDLHKPVLDEIGFQDLITDLMAFWDTEILDTDPPIFKSAGKLPAWMNYMTNYNRTYGNFAIEDNEMFMTLNRRYERDAANETILDLTTYIDPKKFNYIFAETNRDAMNFWVQIAVDIEARRKMSAKVIPNL